jgi:hypothetical protein
MDIAIEAGSAWQELEFECWNFQMLHCNQCESECGGCCADPSGPLADNCLEGTTDNQCGHDGAQCVACDADKVCIQMQCLCRTGTTLCGSSSVCCDIDKCHNGVCGCPSGQSMCGSECCDPDDCHNGVCGCPSGQSMCGSQCCDPDDCHNGVCGCPSGQSMCGSECCDPDDCHNGVCGCPSGQSMCGLTCCDDGMCDNGVCDFCDSSVSSVTSCGAASCPPPSGPPACTVACCTVDNECGTRVALLGQTDPTCTGGTGGTAGTGGPGGTGGGTGGTAGTGGPGGTGGASGSGGTTGEPYCGDGVCDSGEADLVLAVLTPCVQPCADCACICADNPNLPANFTLPYVCH